LVGQLQKQQHQLQLVELVLLFGHKLHTAAAGGRTPWQQWQQQRRRWQQWPSCQRQRQQQQWQQRQAGAPSHRGHNRPACRH
jgi:hypothetical protein